MLVFFDGFDHYDKSGQFICANNWTSDNLASVQGPTPFNAGLAMQLGNGNNIGRSLAPQKSYIFGYAHYPQAANTNNQYHWLAISDAGKNRQLTFRINPSTLAPEIWRGTVNSGVLLGAGDPIASGQYSYIEILCTIDPVHGLAVVNINGEQSINLVNVNTQGYAGNETIGYIEFDNSGQNTWYDDFYVCDLTGNAPFNAMLGPIRVQTLFPGTGGPSTEFAPLRAPNWAMVSETYMDSDTTYNEGTIVTSQDIFKLGANSLYDATQQIFAAAITGCYRYDDGGPHSMSNMLQSGAIIEQGAAVAIASTYKYQQDIFLVDPSTNDNWTSAGINALQLGYKMVS